MTGLRRHDLYVLLVSVAIGTTIVTVNFFHYNSIQTKHSVTYGPDTAQQMTITSGDPFRTSFTFEEPEAMQQVLISVDFRVIDEGTVITPEINSRAYESVQGLTGGSTHTIAVESADLRRENRLLIRGQFGFASSAQIQSVTVEGVKGSQRILFLLLNIFSIIIIIGPILFIKYMQYARIGEMEEQFPNFLRDVVEGTRAGMSLPQAIKNTTSNNYGRLTPHVEEMAAKLEWGIPFDRAVRIFGENTRSDIIKRSVNTIIQTYQSGGNVSDVLEAVGNNLKEIRKLRKERESEIYGEIITGYVIYFVFIFVLVVLIRYFLPSLTFTGSIGVVESGGLSAQQIIATYRSVFRFLIIIQSIFSGLVIGRLSEGQLKAGAKHIGILLGVGYTVAAVFM